MRLVLAAGLLIGLGSQSGAEPPQTSAIQKAVEEFKIQTRQLGMRPDSPRRRSSQGSRGRWHGRLFENLRNDFLDAVPHEIVQRGGRKGLLRRNQFGFNVSGPLVLPKLYQGWQKTFFSISYEGMRETIARTYLRTIPTLAERSGDWSATVDQAGNPLPIYDPLATSANPAYNPSQPVSRENLQYQRVPFAGNVIPASRIDAVAARAVLFYPAPNSDAGPFFRNNYFILSPERSRADGIILRLDHNASDRHRLGFGLTYSDGIDGAAEWFPTIANPGPVSQDRASRRFHIEHVLTASPRTVNTFGLEASLWSSDNITDLDEQGRPFPAYRFSPYLSMGRSYPVNRSARNSFEVSNSWSTRRGAQRIRVGGFLVREQVNSYWPQYPEGSFTFSSQLTSLPGIVNTGHAFASFLLGGADYAERSIVASPSYFRRTRATLWVRDQYEIRKGLSVEAGANLDITTPRVEKYDRQSSVSLTAVNPANGRPGALVAAARHGQGRAFQPTRIRLEPSASLAWNPRGDARSVIRFSISRSYATVPLHLGQWGTQGFNGNPNYISPNSQLQPSVWLRNGLPPLAYPLPDLRPEAMNDAVADLVNPTARQPIYHSASMSVEREFHGSFVLTVGLGHTHGTDLLVGTGAAQPNAIHMDNLRFRDQLNDEAFRRQLRPYPQYLNFDVYSSWPKGRFQRDAGYLRLEKRSSRGLSLRAYYEFSKQMDDYSGPIGIQDYYNQSNEWALTPSNNPHRLSLNYTYELPLGPNKALFTVNDWRRHLVDGWLVSGSSTVSSGEPLVFEARFNNTGRVLSTVYVDPVPGVNPRVAQPGPERWFNPDAFAHPADFTPGTLSRAHPFLRGPLRQNHDISLTKRFPIAADRTIEFSAVGLNFINHANWTDPDTEIGPPHARNANAGRINESRGGRIIQVGLRYSF